MGQLKDSLFLILIEIKSPSPLYYRFEMTCCKFGDPHSYGTFGMSSLSRCEIIWPKTITSLPYIYIYIYILYNNKPWAFVPAHVK